MLFLSLACQSSPDPINLCQAAEGAPILDSWGGDTRVLLPKTGYFTLSFVGGTGLWIQKGTHFARWG
jgi:hypothetical protein